MRTALLRRPTPFRADRWFASIADTLLNRSVLRVAGVPHRLVEVEVYYHGPGHEDPFAHRDPVQLHPGRWYFHRTGGTYRGGSFKGLDLTFGGPVGHTGKAYGGVLFRGLEAPDGTLTDGPSLLVDHLLRTTGFGTVAELDAAIGDRLAWDSATLFPPPLGGRVRVGGASPPWHGMSSPQRQAVTPHPNPPPQGGREQEAAAVGLVLEPAALDPRPVLRTARVGLTLKFRRAKPADPALAFLLRPYRFLTDPRRTAKGKPHMVLALHAAGVPAEEIAARTLCPLAAVRRYAEAFEAGARETDPTPYYGREWGPADLCRLHGLLSKR